jgi:hypothetical protein
MTTTTPAPAPTVIQPGGDETRPGSRADRARRPRARDVLRETAIEFGGLRPAPAAAARRADHVARLVEALRWEPCSPSCPNWLRYGIQPKNPRPTMRPGCCRAKAHKPTHLGYGGRRVLVSRKWTAKDLADHRHDRRAHVLAVLGRGTDDQPGSGESSATEPPDDSGGAVLWELAKQTDPDVPPLPRRVLRLIAHATRWRAEYRTARDGPSSLDEQVAPDPELNDPAA